MVFDVNSMMIK